MCPVFLQHGLFQMAEITHVSAVWPGWGHASENPELLDALKVHNDEEVKALFKQVQGEVPGSPIFVMKLASQSRHLEVQLLCDQYGNVAALHSRDCSVGALDVNANYSKHISRTLAAEYGKHMIRIVRTLFHSLALDLKLDPSLSYLYRNASSGIFRSYRYPCLPECQSYMGMRSHTHSSVLAVVDEDEVGGLQIQQGNTWFSIMPVPDNLIVNIVDMMQVIRNDEYRSVVLLFRMFITDDSATVLRLYGLSFVSQPYQNMVDTIHPTRIILPNRVWQRRNLLHSGRVATVIEDMHRGRR
ncbi:Acetyl-CoA carboxylase 2 [Platanthera guangdongensis]|uniref:Acetyl-CoA carboxylase 2 n=1 Tax=Platanthera guangdongensis TaxID=2320717 RepID=A0ABR2M104_9ASPA